MADADEVNIDSIKTEAPKQNNASYPHYTGSRLEKAGTFEIDLDEKPKVLKKSTTLEGDITLDVEDLNMKKKPPKEGEKAAN